MKNKKVKLKDVEYELIRNDDCYNQEEIEKLVLETDYFDNYDYIKNYCQYGSKIFLLKKLQKSLFKK